MRKALAIHLFALAAVAARGAEFGSLETGIYQILINGSARQTVEVSNGVVSLNLPGGSQLIGLSSDKGTLLAVEQMGTATLDDYDQEVFLSSFDESTLTNRFTLLDRQGLRILEPVQVLEGANTEGKVISTDLDGDGVLEVLAAGYVPEEGVVLEYWAGNGNPLARVSVFDSSFDSDNHLASIDLDGEPGNEALIIGRDEAGAYHVRTYDAEGAPLNQFVAFAGNYERIEAILAEDVRGDGRQEAVILVRTLRDTVEMKVLDGGTVLSTTPLFGSGFVGGAALFSVDLDGDGDKEIGAARKNVRSNSHRLVVADWRGNLLLKTDVLSGKFEEEAVVCTADLDSDGREEIGIVGRLVETGANILEVVDSTGNLRGSGEVLSPSFNGKLTGLCADLNGDGEAEIVVGGKDSNTGMVAYQVIDRTGRAVFGGAFFESGVDFQAALFRADIDRDGDQELLAVGEFKGGRYGLEMRDGSTGLIRFTTEVWETPMELAEGELFN